MTYPNGGEIFDVGAALTVTWQSSGKQVKKINLLLSLDGGATFPIVVADGLSAGGSHAWIVPDSAVSSPARFLAEALSADGRALASDASDFPFEIRPAPPVQEAEPAPEEGEGEGEEESTADSAESAPGSSVGGVSGSAPLVGSEGSLTVISGQDETGEVVDADGEPPHPNCPATLIKAHGAKAVYYCASNGRRYVFPNQQIFFSWYQDFSGVQEIGESEMAVVPLGGNVTYRPGSRLVKVETNPKVYSVAAGRVLRWIKDEIAAVRHFGSDWGKKVDDLPESLFSDYEEGENLE